MSGRVVDRALRRRRFIGWMHIAAGSAAIAVFAAVWLYSQHFMQIPFMPSLRGAGALLVLPSWPYLVSWAVVRDALFVEKSKFVRFAVVLSLTASVGAVLLVVVAQENHYILWILALTLVQSIILADAALKCRRDA